MNEPTRSILLTSTQFEIIFQIAHQLPNFQEVRLGEVGATSADVEILTAVLRSIRGQIDDSSQVRIDLYENPSDVDAALAETQRDSQSNEVTGFLSLELALRWRSLADLVITALGAREVFLRTGYSAEEIDGAASWLG